MATPMVYVYFWSDAIFKGLETLFQISCKFVLFNKILIFKRSVIRGLWFALLGCSYYCGHDKGVELPHASERIFFCLKFWLRESLIVRCLDWNPPPLKKEKFNIISLFFLKIPNVQTFVRFAVWNSLVF